MITYREFKENKLQESTPYQHLRQSGVDLGLRGANKLSGIVDIIIGMAADKDVMLRRIVSLLKTAARGEQNEAEMVKQLNNAYNVLTQAARQHQQPQVNPNMVQQ